MLPKHADFQATLHTEAKSTQRELNPHFRHGKAVGYRYIMGALVLVELSMIKTQSTGWDSNPRDRITGAVSSPLDHQCICQWDQRDLNPHRPG